MLKWFTFILFVFAVLLLIPAMSSDVEREYAQELNFVAGDIEQFRWDYERATSPKTKRAIMLEAQTYLFGLITEGLFPYWYGTKWDFNGTTETPRNGKIACGYFVGNILKHAGFRFNRRNLGMSASEKIVKTFAPADQIQRFSRVSLSKFVKAAQASGNGLYILGLDTHVGFVVVQGDDVGFIHASRTFWNGVRWEKPEEARAVKKSKYRILGKILDEQMVSKWLVNEEFVVVK